MGNRIWDLEGGVKGAGGRGKGEGGKYLPSSVTKNRANAARVCRIDLGSGCGVQDAGHFTRKARTRDRVLQDTCALGTVNTSRGCSDSECISGNAADSATETIMPECTLVRL